MYVDKFLHLSGNFETLISVSDHHSFDRVNLIIHFCVAVHLSCIKGNDAPHVNCEGHSFCGKGCQKVLF